MKIKNKKLNVNIKSLIGAKPKKRRKGAQFNTGTGAAVRKW